jgi:peptidoglycan/xylan/chitin deacetylase (PgdA/CDA1 family)
MFNRAQLAALLDRSRVAHLALCARAHVRSWLTVVVYHSVRPADTPFDAGVIDATPQTLDAHLAFLRRYFAVVDLDALLAALSGGPPLPPNPALVTFDDGYRDNYTIALPILQRHGLRACFFVATGYLGERRTFWWDRIAYLLNCSSRERISVVYPRPLELDLVRAKRQSLQLLLRLVKDVRGLDLERFLVGVAAAAGVPWTRADDRRFADELLMTWDQVRELRRAGMHVQSHTRTHRVLQTLRPAEITDELRGSREALERELGEPIRAIAYPVGPPIADRADLRAAVAATGYRVGFSMGGVNPFGGGLDPFDVRRICFDRNMSMASVRATLALPFLMLRRRAGSPSLPDEIDSSAESPADAPLEALAPPEAFTTDARPCAAAGHGAWT